MSVDQAFAQLHPRVQSLIRQDLGWKRLRRVQEEAIGPVLSADRDVLIIAGTAAGKTEAVWLPVFSSLVEHAPVALGVLCISPLKALIDDQTKRLSRYGKRLDLPVDGWHGDISASRKQRTLQTPPAALIITPESLQGLLMNRRDEVAPALAGLRYVVVDEVHAFAGTVRGQQLQSLLVQVERFAGRRVCRVALSATVSTPALVAGFLRPGEADKTVVVRSALKGPEIDVEVLGFRRRPPRFDRQSAKTGERDAEVHPRDAAAGDRWDIAQKIDRATRGKRALVFAGSRLGVEEMAVLLRDEEVTGTRRPERFHAHHGSLSRELRRSAESAIHETSDAVTVCTSTLELGVDLPDLDLVAQVDVCLSVAGLRQRLGRSGRIEHTRPTLRCYVAEDPGPGSIIDRLRASLVQTIASVELIVREDWVEPTDLADLGLSTLVHQVMACLVNQDGMLPGDLYRLLCVDGPWRRVAPAAFRAVLKALGTRGIIRQDGRQLLLLDEAGHALASRRNFLAVFATPAEYSLRAKGKELGTIPLSYPLAEGSTVAFGGRLWQVVSVRANGWVVDVQPHTHGLPPKFNGSFGQVHARVREEMRRVYAAHDVPTYLDGPARDLLTEGRMEFHELDLGRLRLVEERDGTTLAALWTGDKQLVTLQRWIELRQPGLRPQTVQVGLMVHGGVNEVRDVLLGLLDDVPTGPDLARGVLNKHLDKYDHLLPEDLLSDEHASRTFDIPGAVAVLESLQADLRGLPAGAAPELPAGWTALPAPRPAGGHLTVSTSRSDGS